VSNFWKEFKKPIVGLSPMDGVTDAAMRFITAKHGRPDVIYTEFVSADGLVKAKDKTKLLNMLKFDEVERPVVAQLFGSDPSMFFEASKMILKLGFDGIDINMGCPAKKVEQRGAGAGLIKNHKLAGEVVEAVKKGVQSKIAVSVKTRIGHGELDLKWIEFLCGLEIEALAVHGRTFKQAYIGKADWKAVALAGQIACKADIFFLGNGDVDSISNAKFLISKYKVDGVLIGRGAIGNPWVFSDCPPPHEASEGRLRLKTAIKHAEKFEELFPDYPFFAMRKHLAAYCVGFFGSKKMRIELMQCNSSFDVKKVLGF
jgi:tRNA-dihydrouridine synthase B